MIEGAFLRSAVARGIISDDQALALERFARGDAPAQAGPGDMTDVGRSGERDDERLRFITGFADIFVTIGLFLFLGACAHFGIERFGKAAGYAIVAGLAWALAEFFARRRRMALPSIVLLVIFALSSASAAGFLLVDPMRESGNWTIALDLLERHADRPLSLAAAALITLALVAAHYGRFRVPITVAAAAAALAGLALALVFAAVPGLAEANLNGLVIVAGLAIFALAMRFDLSDPERVTRRTDIAFWLHLLAAPLIVHPILTTLMRTGDGAFSANSAALVLAVVLVLALVALVTDRRAILVSGLAYAGIAFGSLVREAGLTSQSVPLSLLALGAFVLLLSAGWHPLRALVLRALPRPLAARLPHPIGA